MIIPHSIRLFHWYTSAVRGVAYHYAHNGADADNLAQETFLQAYEKLYQLREPERFDGWLQGIAVNVSFMSMRSKKLKISSRDALDAQGEVR